VAAPRGTVRPHCLGSRFKRRRLGIGGDDPEIGARIGVFDKWRLEQENLAGDLGVLEQAFDLSFERASGLPVPLALGPEVPEGVGQPAASKPKADRALQRIDGKVSCQPIEVGADMRVDIAEIQGGKGGRSSLDGLSG
jgi:hypothetical protein